MTRYYPKMMIKPNQPEEEDDMHIVHEHVLKVCRPSILGILDEIIATRRRETHEKPINITDFGTADGKASLSLLNEIIANVRSSCGGKQTIMINYNDQVMNDFNLLSRVLNGNDKLPGLMYDMNVYAAMIPRTMYEKCLPDKYVDLSISSGAVQYLSVKVCNMINGVVQEEANEKERELMSAQAREDWRSFVAFRGRELTPGGYLLTLMPAKTEEGLIHSPLSGGLKMIGVLVRNMKNDGIITEEEYLNTNLNVYYRREEEFQEPFTNPIPEVKELGLEIISSEINTRFFQHPTFHIVNKDSEDKKKYAERVVSSIRPWFSHVMYEGLSNSRTEPQKEDIVNNFWERLFKYAYDNCQHKPFLVYSVVVIKRSK